MEPNTVHALAVRQESQVPYHLECRFLGSLTLSSAEFGSAPRTCDGLGKSRGDEWSTILGRRLVKCVRNTRPRLKGRVVVNFLSTDWEPKHVTVGLFEASDTTGAALAVQLRLLLEKFDLTNKVICYVKDEGTNLATMTQALKTVVNYDVFGQAVPFEGACFGHTMSKACQYATANDKVSESLQPVSIKAAQASIQSCITWPKKSGKGRNEWNKACMDSGMRPRKLNTPVKTRFASKVMMFQHALQFRYAITLCYNRQTVALHNRIPSTQTWAVAEAISSTLFFVVSACVLNQSRGFWLLSDALASTISMAVRLDSERGELEARVRAAPRFDFYTKLVLLSARIMREQVVKVLSPFLSFIGS